MNRVVILLAVTLVSFTAFEQTDLTNLPKMKTIRANSEVADIHIKNSISLLSLFIE